MDARAGVIAAVLLALNPLLSALRRPRSRIAAGAVRAVGVDRRTARGRPFWTGIWLGAAIVTKAAGAALRAAGAGRAAMDGAGRGTHAGRGLLRWGGGLLLVVLPVLWWDSLRWAVAPSPWDLGARNAAGFALVPVATWPALGRMGCAGGLLVGGPAIWLLWLAGALALVAAVARSERVRATNWWPAALLAGWGVGYWMLHVVTMVPGVGSLPASAGHPATLLAAFGADRLQPLSRPNRRWAKPAPALRPALHTVPIIQRQSPRLLLAILAGVLLVVLGRRCGPRRPAAGRRRSRRLRGVG